jgi:ADP-ribose pyrophosphatase
MSRRRTPNKKMGRKKVIYSGRVFRIEREPVTIAGGHVVQMEAVRHRGSVVLIPQPTPDEVILIRQFRYVVNRWLWELPAGSLEAGEQPARAAKRECEEETGWRPSRVQRLGSFYPSPGFCDERMIFYACTGLIQPAKRRAGDPDEQIEPKTYAIAAIWDLIDAGEVADMKTIVGLTLLDRRLARSTAARRRLA